MSLYYIVRGWGAKYFIILNLFGRMCLCIGMMVFTFQPLEMIFSVIIWSPALTVVRYCGFVQPVIFLGVRFVRLAVFGRKMTVYSPNTVNLRG